MTTVASSRPDTGSPWSFSYLDSREGQATYRTGPGDRDVPPAFAPHLTHLLDEAPVPVVVMAVEETITRARLPPKQIWRNVAKLAESLSVHRRALWNEGHQDLL